MGLCNYSCTELPEHILISCGAWKKGGSNQVAIVDCGAIANWASETEWQAAIANGEVRFVKQIKVNIPEASIVTGEGPIGCGPTDVLDGYDNTVEFKDFNVTPENMLFYNALSDRQFYVAVYHCEDDEITVYEDAMTGAANYNVPESNKEKRFFQVTLSGSSTDLPLLSIAPPGIFV